MLVQALEAPKPADALPIVGGKAQAHAPLEPVADPFTPSQILGHCAEASPGQIDTAFTAASAAQPGWNAAGGAARADVLRAMADALEGDGPRLMALLVREAGKTWPTPSANCARPPISAAIMRCWRSASSALRKC